jgi:hypothetical protein
MHAPPVHVRRLDQVREFKDRELLGELIEHAALARRRRHLARQLDASHRVANVDISARLAPFAVDR